LGKCLLGKTTSRPGRTQNVKTVETVKLIIAKPKSGQVTFQSKMKKGTKKKL